MIFPFFTAFLLFVIILALRYRQLYKRMEEKDKSFWNRENEANRHVVYDLTNLEYITIPLDKFPLDFSDDSRLKSIKSTLTDLSEKNILNITGKTNTDLKLEYGANNFDKIVDAGDNFDTLVITLNSYSDFLIENELFNQAIEVLEYAVSIGTDTSSTFTRLASLYLGQNDQPKIDSLIATVEERSNLPLKATILKTIGELCTNDLVDSSGTEDSLQNK